MKVLFVSSGRNGKVNDLVINQGKSLQKKGIDITYFSFRSGLWGYFSGIFKLLNLLKSASFDVIHAHYSLSAIAASFAGKKPLVVSLLGSDVYKTKLIRWITKLFSKYRWKATIVKTLQMKTLLNLKKAEVIPNGVDIERFRPIEKEVAREYINFPINKKLVVFVSNPNRYEKNFALAISTLQLIGDDSIELMTVYNVPNEEIPYYLNAANALLLTSKREGSVNVVKEAMACNIPIVSTDVGDVRQNTEGLKGCYICDFLPESLSLGLKKALEIDSPINSRSRIIEMGLDSDTIANKIIGVYKQVLSNGA